MIFKNLENTSFNKSISIVLILLFSISFDYIFSLSARTSFNQFDTYQKVIILLLILISLFINGYNKGVNYNLFTGYSILLFNTLFFNDFLKKLSYYNTFSAYAGFLIGFLILKTRFHQSKLLYKVIIFLPLISICIKFFFGFSLFREEFGSYRLHTFLSPAHLAFLCFNVIFFQLILLLNNKKTKIPHLIIINYIILILTLSRSGIFLGTIMILYAIYLTSNKPILSKKQKFIIKGLLFLIPIPLIYLIFQILLKRTESFNDSKYNINTSGREEMWMHYLSKLNNENIYLGNGLGSLKTIDTSDLSVLVTNSHNEYIRIVVENGILGFIIFFIYFFIHFKNIRNTLAFVNIANFYTLFVFLILLYCITDNYFTTIFSWYLYCFIINLVTSKRFLLQIKKYQ